MGTNNKNRMILAEASSYPHPVKLSRQGFGDRYFLSKKLIIKKRKQ